MFACFSLLDFGFVTIVSCLVYLVVLLIVAVYDDCSYLLIGFGFDDFCCFTILVCLLLLCSLDDSRLGWTLCLLAFCVVGLVWVLLCEILILVCCLIAWLL